MSHGCSSIADLCASTMSCVAAATPGSLWPIEYCSFGVILTRHPAPHG